MRSSVSQYEYCLSTQVCLQKRMYCEMQFKTLGHCFVSLLQKITLEGKLQYKRMQKKNKTTSLYFPSSSVFAFLHSSYTEILSYTHPVYLYGLLDNVKLELGLNAKVIALR